MLCDMLTQESRAALQQFLTDRGIDAAAVTPVAAVQAMTDWYEAQRVEGVEADGGDMLLFQWGTYDFGGGPSFEFDLVRQLIVDDEIGDDAIWQLHLTLWYPPDETIESESHWCDSVDDVSEFRAAMLGNATVEQIAGRRPERIEVLLEMAG
jgi:hypothetical protein